MSRITNQRDDYLHKITDQLVKEYDVIVIVIEDLNLASASFHFEIASSAISSIEGSA